MSVILNAVSTESGVPMFQRKRGPNEGIQFSTSASLQSLSMFAKCNDASLLETQLLDGAIVWKDCFKSITLIGIATGGLESELPLLLSLVQDVMVFFVGKKELENVTKFEKLKRDLRSCYGILDCLLESLDPATVSGSHPTMLLDCSEYILCSEATQLQAVEQYAEAMTGRWACLSIHGRAVVTSADWSQLDPREARILLLHTAVQAGAPLRDTAIYLPYTSPNVAYRAITCKLLADVYVLVICGPSPSLAQVDEIVLRCWENFAQLIKEAKMTVPRNFPNSMVFDAGILGLLIVKINGKKCVSSWGLDQIPQQKGRALSGAHKLDILRTFYIRSARDLAPEMNIIDENSKREDEFDGCLRETYWCSEYHKCHAKREGEYLCCVLYISTLPTHTIRFPKDPDIKIACKPCQREDSSSSF